MNTDMYKSVYLKALQLTDEFSSFISDPEANDGIYHFDRNNISSASLCKIHAIFYVWKNARKSLAEDAETKELFNSIDLQICFDNLDKRYDIAVVIR